MAEAQRPVAAGEDRRIAAPTSANACYFRSGPPTGYRKALLKITDRCDLRCSHCLVSATASGADMNVADLRLAIDRLVAGRVSNATITGGEPLMHPDLPEFLSILIGAGMSVTVCTNAVELTDEVLQHARDLGRVSFNVSLDGTRETSHGVFRGRPETFDRTLQNLHALSRAGLLKGILNTPNVLMNDEEFPEMMALADEVKAEYVLMNPLSSFGRGIRNRRLRADDQAMEAIQARLDGSSTAKGPERVFIRFPNRSRPLTSCIAGDVLYVFPNGDITVCPYLVFATENPGAQHSRSEFVLGNLFDDVDIARKIDDYRFHDRYPMGTNSTCTTCSQSSQCGKGCPAAVIAAGGRIGDLDAEVCPMTDGARQVELDVRRR